MKSIVIILFFVFCCQISFAHQVDISSTVLAEQENGEWILQIRAALTAFEYEIHSEYGKDSYKTPEEFESLVLEHVQKNFKGIANDKIEFELIKGRVVLGHETSVVFLVSPKITDITKLNITHTTFARIRKNRSALVLLKKNSEPQQFNLDPTNNHNANLIYEDAKFVSTIEDTQIDKQDSTLIIVLGGITVLFVISGLIFKKKRGNSYS